MATINWKTGSSGLWSDASDWSAGSTPTTTSAVLISATPAASGTPYVVTLNEAAAVASVTLAQSLATLEVEESVLTIGTKFTLAAGTLDLVDGTLTGGTYYSQSGTVVADSGYFSSLAVDGTLNVSTADNGELFLDSVTFAGNSGTGAGAIVLAAAPEEYNLFIEQTSLNNVDITLGINDSIVAGNGTESSFTLGSGSVISTSGSLVNGYENTTYFSTNFGQSFLNQGKIIDASGAVLNITVFSFINSGTISVSNGGSILMSAGSASGSFAGQSSSSTNTGLFSVGAGSYMELSVSGTGAISSSGSVSVAGTLGLNFTVATAQVAQFPVSTGTLAILGTLTNTGGTLNTGSGTKLANLWLDGGEIIGGKIVSPANFEVAGGTLSGVTIDGKALLTAPASGGFSNVAVIGSLTTTGTGGTGSGTLSLSAGVSLDFESTTTLNNVAISFAGTSTAAYNIEAGTTGESAGTTLTFGASANITQSSTGYSTYLTAETAQDALVNDGTIAESVSGNAFFASGLTNAGAISVTNQGNFYWAPNASTTGTTLVNSGTITISGAGALFETGQYSSDNAFTLLNSGLLSVSGTASGFGLQTGFANIYSASLSNSGTLQVSNGAVLALGELGGQTWTNSGTFVLSGGDISLYGTFTSTQLGKVVISNGGVLDIAGTLTNSGTLAIGTGTSLTALTLIEGAEIAGGTIKDAGGGLVVSGGELSGLTYDGTLNFSTSADVTLGIAGGLTMAGAAGTGAGTISLSGSHSVLNALGTETFTNTVIDFGASTLDFTDPSSGATTLTLAANSSLVQTASNGEISGRVTYTNNRYVPTGDTLVNDGAITETLKAGNFSLFDANLLNAGSFDIGNGTELDINNGTFTNQGTLLITGTEISNSNTVASQIYFSPDEADGFTNTGLVTIGAGGQIDLDVFNYYTGLSGITWSNTGTILLSGGQLLLGGTVTTAQLGNIVVSDGSSVAFDNDFTLNNSNATLTVGGTSTLGTISLAGTIHGGTIIDQGNGINYVESYDEQNDFDTLGDLDDVRYEGILRLASTGEAASITGGISLTGSTGSGAGSIAVTGAGDVLFFASQETLSNATVTIGAASDGPTLTGTNLTLAASATIQQAGASATIGSSDVYFDNNSLTSTIANAGTITAAQTGGVLTLAGDFVNSGKVLVSNGETLLLDTTSLSNTGTISVTNGLLEVGNVTAAQLTLINLVNSPLAVTGTLTATGSTLTVGAGTALPSIDLAGEILGGTIKDAGGGISFFGYSVLSDVTYEGTLNLNRPGGAVLIENSFATTGSSGSGAGSIAITGAGSDFILDTAQALNNATISIGNPGLTYEGNQLSAPALVEDSYYGSGTPLVATLGAQLTINQTGTYADIGGEDGNTSGGSLVSAATINAGFAGGAISLEGQSFTNTGSIAISKTDTVTEGAANFTNTGLITIGSGSALNLNLYNYFETNSFAPQDFTNLGTVSLAGGTLTELTDNGTFPSVPLLNAATITGFGTIQSAIVNNGTITAAGGTLTLAQPVTGTGTLAVDAGATLSLAAISAGETAIFSGTGGILGLAPASFLGEIGGFASGDTIDLASTTATTASFSGTSLVVTLSTGSTIKLATTTALTGTLKATAGTHGDSLITFATATINGPRAHALMTQPLARDAQLKSTDPFVTGTLSHPSNPLETWAAHLAH